MLDSDLSTEIVICDTFPKIQVQELFNQIVSSQQFKFTTVSLCNCNLAEGSLHIIKKFFTKNKFKGVKHTSQGVYSLELENNAIASNDMKIF